MLEQSMYHSEQGVTLGANTVYITFSQLFPQTSCGHCRAGEAHLIPQVWPALAEKPLSSQIVRFGAWFLLHAWCDTVLFLVLLYTTHSFNSAVLAINWMLNKWLSHVWMNEWIRRGLRDGFGTFFPTCALQVGYPLRRPQQTSPQNPQPPFEVLFFREKVIWGLICCLPFPN